MTIKTIYIANFSPVTDFANKAYAPSAQQVQKQILHEINKSAGLENVLCLSVAPNQMWPMGNLYINPVSESNIRFISYINISVVRNIIIFCKILSCLFKHPVETIIVYNCRLSMIMPVRIVSMFNKNIFSCCIVQDIYMTRNSSKSIRSHLRAIVEKTSLYFIRQFSCVVAITADIIADFKIPKENSFVFSGGITNYALSIINEPVENLENIAVFAGGLVEHNGVGLLAESWINQNINFDLYIFGKGRLSARIEEISKTSSHVKYMGFLPEEALRPWLRRSKWNFCLRYSRGIDSRYFFPSKFYNLLSAPGVIFVNQSQDIPEDLRSDVIVLNDDLSDLSEQLNKSIDGLPPETITQRRQKLQSQHSWSYCVEKIFSRKEQFSQQNSR